MSLTYDQVEELIDQAIDSQAVHLDYDLTGRNEYEAWPQNVLSDLKSELPSPLKLSEGQYEVKGDKINIDAHLDHKDKYDITIERLGAAEYQGIIFHIDDIHFQGIITLDQDPENTDETPEISDSYLVYRIIGSGDPY